MTFRGYKVRFGAQSWLYRLVAVLVFVTLPLGALMVAREEKAPFVKTAWELLVECLEVFVSGDLDGPDGK